MDKDKKPVRTVTVRIKVFADTKEEAEKLTTTLMTEGVKATDFDPSTLNYVKHWQIKQ